MTSCSVSARTSHGHRARFLTSRPHRRSVRHDPAGHRATPNEDPGWTAPSSCPFLDVERQHPDVVSSLHLGMMRGALQTLAAPVEAHDLAPFVQPSLCVTNIATTLDRAS